ncbi:MAG: DsbA family protein [Sphingomonadales bacterium]
MQFIKTVFTLFIFGAALAFPALAQETEDLDAKERFEFEQKVREFILANPEVIAEAIRILNERADAASKESTKLALLKNRELLINDPLSIVLGNPEGDVTLVEFYDYRCPYCRDSHEKILRLLASDPGVRLVLKQFPVKDRPGETPVSLISARLAKVAHEQGVFEAFHNAMFEAQPPLTRDRVFQIATRAGVSMDKILDQMSNPLITKHLRETMILANAIGATGTPTFVMGEFVIPGAVDYEIFLQLVEYTRSQKVD